MEKNDFTITQVDNGVIVSYHELISKRTKLYKFEEMEELYNDLDMWLNKNHKIGDMVKIIKKEKV